MHTCTATYRVLLNTCTHTDLLPMVVQACTCRCIPMQFNHCTIFSEMHQTSHLSVSVWTDLENS